jgi:hypothetical protein
MQLETWRVADEHDQGAFQRLGDSLRELGYVNDMSNWGIGGSQELAEWTLTRNGGTLQITAETYMGLTVCGPIGLVAELKLAYQGLGAR